MLCTGPCPPGAKGTVRTGVSACLVLTDAGRAQAPVWWREAGEFERLRRSLNTKLKRSECSLVGEGALPSSKTLASYLATAFVSFVCVCVFTMYTVLLSREPSIIYINPTCKTMNNNR